MEILLIKKYYKKVGKQIIRKLNGIKSIQDIKIIFIYQTKGYKVYKLYFCYSIKLFIFFLTYTKNIQHFIWINMNILLSIIKITKL